LHVLRYRGLTLKYYQKINVEQDIKPEEVIEENQEENKGE